MAMNGNGRPEIVDTSKTDINEFERLGRSKAHTPVRAGHLVRVKINRQIRQGTMKVKPRVPADADNAMRSDFPFLQIPRQSLAADVQAQRHVGFRQNTRQRAAHTGYSNVASCVNFKAQRAGSITSKLLISLMYKITFTM
jgi:hypothetical protein